MSFCDLPEERIVDQGETKDMSLNGFSYFTKSFRFNAVDAAKQHAENAYPSYNPEVSLSGLQFEREGLTIENTSGRRISLIEQRYSTLLTMTPLCAPIGNFRLFSIADTVEAQYFQLSHPIQGLGWKAKGIYPAGFFMGIAAFQAQLHWVITSCAEDWDETLNHLSAAFSVTASQSQDRYHQTYY